MTLIQMIVFVCLALVSAAVVPRRWQGWMLFTLSVGAIFWLQPTLPIRWLDFTLPFATLILTGVIWVMIRPATAPDSPPFSRDDALTAAVGLGIVGFLSLGRYLAPIESLQITSRPPEIIQLILAIALTAGLVTLYWRGLREKIHPGAAILLIIGLFILIKTEPLAIALSRFLRSQAGQSPDLASALDLNWLGFSYVAFRLIHTLRDYQTGILPLMSLREYVTYVIFFPAFTAGPIDRAERFLADYRALPEQNLRDADRLANGFRRIFIGMFKKFVIADSLALFALSVEQADYAVSAPALWVMLYGYAFRLFFDFSGYTDIAIGIGILFGITLPENFNLPYLKNNINAFWQSWHMTLSAWVRAYVYSPLQRSLLRRQPKPPQNLVILVCHLTTMLIIGLWHGVTLPFVIWGLWHGTGLFVHKLWSDRTRKWFMSLKNKPRLKQAWHITGILLTFHFVCLGWVFFALPDIETALRVFARLFGMGW